jgi:hypothetical protein
MSFTSKDLETGHSGRTSVMSKTLSRAFLSAGMAVTFKV